jgi:nicotinamide phosphoribosyltransferase
LEQTVVDIDNQRKENNMSTHKLSDNTILMADAYKQTHWQMYKNLDFVYSYLEPRYGKFKEVVSFGYQMVLKDHFVGKKIEQWMIEQADDEFFEIFGTREYFNREGWQYIVDFYDGKLPLEIKVVPEGTILGIQNAVMSIVNTDPKLAWLTNWAETILMHTWYTLTTATKAYEFAVIGKKYAEMSGENLSPVFLNDFGYRGAATNDAAGRAGCAVLTSTIGTDTLRGIAFAKDYYNAKGMVGVSVKASEHSNATQNGPEGELDIIRDIIRTTPRGMIVSIVIDSYNDTRVVDFITKDMAEEIKELGVKVVLRPDSGDPVTKSYEVLTRIWDNVGGTINEKGYKVLDPRFAVIYGDGIKIDTIDKILKAVVEYGKFAASNIVFGSGGGLLQDHTRDTMGYAIKCSANFRNGEWRDVYKDPITDTGKRSKRGQLAVILENGIYKTIRLDELGDREDILETVFRDGELVKEYNFADIRKRVGILA